MDAHKLIRWGGLSALAGGILGILGEFGWYFTVGCLKYSEAAVKMEWSLFTALMAFSTILAMLGLVVFYARQSQDMGKFGLAAFILALIGSMMVFGHQWTGTFVVPVLAENVPDFLDAITADTTTVLAGGVFLSMFFMAIGWFLFGLATLKARLFPAGPVWLMVIGALFILVLSILEIDLDKFVFNLGLGWLGWLLWSEKAKNQ